MWNVRVGTIQTQHQSESENVKDWRVCARVRVRVRASVCARVCERKRVCRGAGVVEADFMCAWQSLSILIYV